MKRGVKFQYLGVIISANGKMEEEVNCILHGERKI